MRITPILNWNSILLFENLSFWRGPDLKGNLAITVTHKIYIYDEIICEFTLKWR